MFHFPRPFAFAVAAVSILPVPCPAAAPSPAPLIIPSPERTTYLLSYWLVDFKREFPQVATRIEVTHAEDAADALVRGRAPLVMLNRPLSADESRAFTERFGYAPTRFVVAHDALRVYVNAANPLAGITREQLDAVFSTSRRCGARDNIFWWDQLGLRGEWKIRQIELYGPNAYSGARSMFALRALCEGTHKATLEMAQNGHDLLVLVARNRAAIAYDDDEARESGVREVPVAARAGEEFVPATLENIRRGRYPLRNAIYFYLNRKPGTPVDPVDEALVKIALSPLGRQRAEAAGFAPVESAEAEAAAAQLR
jgi:phosphate transport system substrate-binding protein